MINNAIYAYISVSICIPAELHCHIYTNDVLCKVLHNCILYVEIDDHLEIKEKSITVNGKVYLYTRHYKYAIKGVAGYDGETIYTARTLIKININYM